MEHDIPFGNSNRENGTTFFFHFFWKFSSGTNRRNEFHLPPNRKFRKFWLNGKRLEKSALSSLTAAGNRANTTLSFFPSLIWQKIGRPSDVWSLGCILYMMVYGRTPFQHITNHLQKLQCIMDPSHVIEFPDINDKHLLDVIEVCLVICSCFT